MSTRADQTISAATGKTVILSASATGTAPFSYKWYVGGTQISGATSASYQIDHAQVANSGRYTVVVSNDVGSVTSDAVIVSITDSTPVITIVTQPQASQTVTAGANVSFTVAGTGSSNLAYRWRKDGVDLTDGSKVSGSNTATLALNGVSTTDAGKYSVVVSDGTNPGVASADAVLVVNQATQSITFAVVPVKTVGDAPFTLNPTASSGLPVGFTSSDSNVATVAAASSGFQVTIKGAGTATLTASQAGNIDYAAAANVTQVLTVKVATPVNPPVPAPVPDQPKPADPITIATAPAIVTQPSTSIVATAGQSVSLSVSATGTATLTYRWRKDGVDLADGGRVSGAQTATLHLNAITTADAGSYTATVSNGTLPNAVSNSCILSVAQPAPVTPDPIPNPTPDPGPVTPDPVVNPTKGTTFVNIATRVYCEAGDRVSIGGFVVSGNTPKQVLLRAVGPTLATLGVPSASILADPMITVYDARHGNAVVASNDDWVDNVNSADIVAAAARIGATALASTDTASSALLLTLQPGVYTFTAGGKGTNSGIVLVEVYDADAAAGGSKFVNIATRAYCATGDRVSIGGFVVSGTAPKRVLLRAMGPSLAAWGVASDAVLADPVITVYDARHGNAVVASNDNWVDNANSAEILATSARVGASPLAATDTTSSAALLTLQPGVYTFTAAGKGSSSGIVLVEVYDAD